MEESGFVDQTAESIAKFLFRQERLSKKQIGKTKLVNGNIFTIIFIFRKIPWKSPGIQ